MGSLIAIVAAIVFFCLWWGEKQKHSMYEIDKEVFAKELESFVQELNSKNKELDSKNKELLECQHRYDEIYRVYKPIVDLDEHIKHREKQLQAIEGDISRVQESYKSKRKIYDELKAKVAIYDEQLELANVGIYEPHFDFGTSEKYKEVIKSNRETQKEMVKQQRAVIGGDGWTVNGSAATGAKMARQAKQLTLRSFNNECDAAIANTTWKNFDRMESRIHRAFEAINKFNKTNRISINSEYLTLKIDELRLVHEHKLKVQQEREEQAELRRLEREEEQLRKEAEKARAEELKLQNLLAKIQEQANHSQGEELESLKAEIVELGEELKELQRKNDRVKSMAEQTKLGYVYVISNIGSFGKDVYKIGMTRRLDPMDRVRELGDASVPFYFDVHAMVFSEDAPALEAQLQREFADRRVNLVNYRKEFFNVELNEIKDKLLEIDPNVNFVDEVEAKEYFESLELRNQVIEMQKTDEMPDEI
ncbi:Uncharacterized protein conserved in bacteria with the myosin-like domain [Moraxella caviae]|nr:DUF4041 domain-containing protein [Moraxella caviae]STZ14506.1 Uncharacterized protein conserved in bacteria with the myosin-like domain [Moraxella caviae]VEW11314.1 Uncharacterized protein conserved in bacteria with the myosin-like domain [Moraxella caviae]